LKDKLIAFTLVGAGHGAGHVAGVSDGGHDDGTTMVMETNWAGPQR
jgi:hypothetical protein